MRHDRHFVDELTQRMGEGIGRMLPVDAISSNQDQPRATLGELDDLVASIGRHGVLEPLLVRKKDNAGYELVSGERRFHAALQVGLQEVPCIELEVGDDLALEIALVENLQRRDLSAFEEAEGYRTLIDKYDYTHEHVAAAVGRSRVTVTETIKLLTIPEEIRDLCRHADISAKSVLLEIAKAPTTAAMKELIRSITEENVDREELRRQRQEIEQDTQLAQSDDGSRAHAQRSRPFVFKFRDQERGFSVSLSFKSKQEPDREQVIEVLEQMIRELRQG